MGAKLQGLIHALTGPETHHPDGVDSSPYPRPAGPGGIRLGVTSGGIEAPGSLRREASPTRAHPLGPDRFGSDPG